ncbi:MAG: hypothetical protein AAGC57_01825 [Pseudomonadota bacterium]
MSLSTDQAPKASLGVGALISDSFSVFFSKIIHILVLGFVPALAGLVISGFVQGWGITVGLETPAPGDFAVVPLFLSLILQLAVYGIGVAMLVLLAYDAKQGRSRPIAGYFIPALQSAVPIAILTMAATLLMGLGLVAFVIPGIWIYACLSVIVPAVMIDRSGFGALQRSFTLTKGYRWPIVVVLIVVMICTGLINTAAMFLFGLMAAALGTGGLMIFVTVMGLSVIAALSYGLTGIALVLIHARLCEIKEGARISDLASVFD